MSKSSKNKLTLILFLVVLAVILTILAVWSYLSDRITPNPPGTVGNTAGNLNNMGYFCEHDGTVYFANAFDSGALYAMDPDEGQIRKLNNSNVVNILAGGNYLYYFQKGAAGTSGLGGVRMPHSFNRCTLKGTDTTSLTRDTVVSGQLVNDYLYLLTSVGGKISFYKMKTDKSDQTVLADYEVNPACARDGIIYYNGTQNDHYLYTLNTSNDVSTELWRGNIWYPVLDGDYVYYMDVDNNYRICRYSLSQNVVEVLTNDRADCFNIGNGYIYYQKNGSNPELICMRMDGSEPITVAEGTYTNINMTSRYVYFQEFSDPDSWYHSYLGSSYTELFFGAREAAPAAE